MKRCFGANDRISYQRPARVAAKLVTQLHPNFDSQSASWELRAGVFLTASPGIVRVYYCVVARGGEATPHPSPGERKRDSEPER